MRSIAASKRAMSSACVVGPVLTRTAARAIASATPIARSVCEAPGCALEQAEPLATANPSRSSSITQLSPTSPGNAKKVVFGNRSAPAEKMVAPRASKPVSSCCCNARACAAHTRCAETTTGATAPNAASSRPTATNPAAATPTQKSGRVPGHPGYGKWHSWPRPWRQRNNSSVAPAANSLPPHAAL